MTARLTPLAVGLALLASVLLGAAYAQVIGHRTDRGLEKVVPIVEAELEACAIEHATACAVDGTRIVPAPEVGR